MNQQSSAMATVRVVGAWFIVAGLLTGAVAAGTPHVGYRLVAGLLVVVGIGLPIEAAIRDVDRRVLLSRSTDADLRR